MVTHSSILAWRIPGTWEPGGLPSIGSRRVGHDWSDLATIAIVNCFLCLVVFVLPFLSCRVSLVAQIVKNPHAIQENRVWRSRFDPWVRKMPWGRKWHPTPVFLPGKSHGQRSLVGYSPWGCKELNTTEQLTPLLTLSSLASFHCVLLIFFCVCVVTYFSFPFVFIW